MANKAPADCALLRAIARSRCNDSEFRIADLAGKVTNWDALLRLAEDHRMMPMLFARLAQSGVKIPAGASERLQSAYQRNLVISMANTAELIALLNSFEDAGIQAIPFKGVVLAQSVYGEPASRQAGDLDILIDVRDLPRAGSTLFERGYELQTPMGPDGLPDDPDCFECHFERPGDGMITELRWRFDLVQPKFLHNLGIKWVMPYRRVTSLAGAEIPDLAPELLLILLSMHGSKHNWARLLWICDIGQLLSSHPSLDWRTVLRETRRAGLWRSTALGVLLAQRITGCQIPAKVLHSFESDYFANGLALHFENCLFHAPGSLPDGLVPYNFRLFGFWDRLRLFLSGELLRPTERDRAVVALPKWLGGLYYLIRPFRILWHRSPR
jgi:putative nucleotidyltransferase-like protein